MAQENNKQKTYTYTLISYGLLVLLLFLVRWNTPAQPPVLVEDGIEVNLGNSDEGLGDVQPLIPGPPSASEESNYAPPKTSQSAPEDIKNVETDESDESAPEVAAPKKPTTSTKVEDKPVSKPNTSKTQPVANPTPAPPKPKAVYKGGTASGTGGNNADGFNKSTNQGIAGGSGDQGKLNGNPNSDNYNGNGGTGNSGISIRLTGRKHLNLPSFEDDFNENGKIAVDIRVDKSGKVIAATYQPRGSSSANPTLKAIALKKAREIKFNAIDSGPDEQIGTVIFNFKLRG